MFQASGISQFHQAYLEHVKKATAEPNLPDTLLWQAIADNHRCNTLLWDEEDQARRRDVPDSAIAQSKRLIDGHNQRRNDAAESIDDTLLAKASAGEMPSLALSRRALASSHCTPCSSRRARARCSSERNRSS